MNRVTAGLAAAALLAVAAPAVLVPGALAATPGTDRGAAAAVVSAAGPRPLSWQGGHAVPVAPRWWPQGKGHASAPWDPRWPRPVAFSPTHTGRLHGLVIGLDPGHDIGNRNHISDINKKYWVGLTKICNTTGTATNSGYPEATYNFDVVARLRRLLVAGGATVMVTRDRNDSATFGPCVGARGAFGAQEHANVMLQVHADGGPSGGRGFHVIVPAYYKGYTDDIYRSSRTFGLAMAAGMVSRGFPHATYLSSVLQVRKDQGGLNSSDIPTVTVETLNMRNAGDARLATSAAGRQRIAEGLYAGLVRYFHR